MIQKGESVNSMRERRDSRMWILWTVLCPLFYMFVLWHLVPFVYGIVDDRTMMEVVSGQYLGTPDGHTIFIGYWYSCLLAGLYGLLPGVDWYALGFLALQAVCMGLILYRLLKGQTGRAARIGICVLVLLWCALLGLRTVAQLTFTTTAAVLAVTALFWYRTAEKFRAADLAVLFFLCFLTAEARSVVYYMIVPVCGVFWVFRFWNDRKAGKQDRGHLLVPLIAGGALLLHLGGFAIGYRSEGWRAYNDYNDTCTVIFDYDDYMFPRYEDDTELYNEVGIRSKVRAKNLFYYNYTADDQIDMDFFSDYLELRKEIVKERRDPPARLYQTFRGYVKNVLTGAFGYGHLLALAGYGALILWYGLKKEWLQALRVCCVYGAQFVLWMYLLYRGRAPLRVVICMNLMLVVALLLLWMEKLRELDLSAKVRAAGAAAMMLLLLAAFAGHVRTVRQENLEMQSLNEDVEALKEYCADHPDNFYFNDVVSMAMSSYNVHLWLPEPYEMNYISLGDWISFSPAWAQKLEQRGITDVPDALYRQDNVYLICSFDRGLEYLTTMYENVTYTEVDKVAGFGIYQLRR